MRDTIRGIPVGNRARERIGYLMRDAISMAIRYLRRRVRGDRRFLPRTHNPQEVRVRTVKKGTNATRVKFLSSPTE